MSAAIDEVLGGTPTLLNGVVCHALSVWVMLLLSWCGWPLAVHCLKGKGYGGGAGRRGRRLGLAGVSSGQLLQHCTGMWLPGTSTPATVPAATRRIECPKLCKKFPGGNLPQ